MAKTKDLITSDKFTKVIIQTDKTETKYYVLVMYLDKDSDAIMFKPVLSRASILSQLDDTILLSSGVVAKECDCGEGYIVKAKHSKTKIPVDSMMDGQSLAESIKHEAHKFRADEISRGNLGYLYPIAPSNVKVGKLNVDITTGEVSTKGGKK